MDRDERIRNPEFFFLVSNPVSGDNFIVVSNPVSESEKKMFLRIYMYPMVSMDTCIRSSLGVDNVKIFLLVYVCFCRKYGCHWAEEFRQSLIWTRQGPVANKKRPSMRGCMEIEKTLWLNFGFSQVLFWIIWGNFLDFLSTLKNSHPKSEII